jgi:hypothetical protein
MIYFFSSLLESQRHRLAPALQERQGFQPSLQKDRLGQADVT